jgi:hypothetical protein
MTSVLFQVTPVLNLAQLLSNEMDLLHKVSIVLGHVLILYWHL